eukprot:tig00000144_g9169.t1
MSAFATPFPVASYAVPAVTRAAIRSAPSTPARRLRSEASGTRVHAAGRRQFFGATQALRRPSSSGLRLAGVPKLTVEANASVPAALSSLGFTNDERVQVLSEALPYILKFTGKTMVIKYGGAAMVQSDLKDFVIRDLVFLSLVGIRPIFVHGGGPEINQWLSKVGIEKQFRNGLRVTDGPTMDVVEMVLTGRVNKELVALINKAGGRAVGICGKDGGLFQAIQRDPEYGFVGDVGKVDTKLLDTLTQAGYIPVVASVAADESGQPYNINADTVAGEIAGALKAEKLILLTDVPGILKDAKDPGTLISVMNTKEAHGYIDSGVISGGMIPKVTCCMDTLKKGVNATHIIDGRKPHSLLLEIFTDGGIGTVLLPEDDSDFGSGAI